MKRVILIGLLLIVACGKSGDATDIQGRIRGVAWAAIQVETLSGRTVDCVVYGSHALSCDWNER